MSLASLTQTASISGRTQFIRKTYGHLFAAILLFIGIEVLLFQTGVAETIARFVFSTSWLAVLGAFAIVGWLASRVAHRATSRFAQYLGLGLYIVAEALIFVPLLYMAQSMSGLNIINDAAVVTLLAFSGLTWLVLYTQKDFSFLGIFLKWAAICALSLIVAGVLFSFHLGMVFDVAMVCFAGAAILYDTSNVLHHFDDDRYVAASLQLFSSIALMFWYLLSIFSRD